MHQLKNPITNTNVNRDSRERERERTWKKDLIFFGRKTRKPINAFLPSIKMKIYKAINLARAAKKCIQNL